MPMSAFWSTSTCRGFRATCKTKEKSFWAHIDIDTLKPGSPMWTFPGNLRMQGDSGRILEQVLDELKAKATPRFKAAAAARLDAIKALRDERIARAAKLAADKGKPGAINPHYLMAELGKVLDDDAIIFNEGVTNAGAVLLQIPRKRPNTTMRSGGGGLGWSGGFALGAKLAAPDRMMVQISGDGGFYFGNPSSVFAVSQQYKLPIFSIVMDNTGWNAVKQSTLRVFPEGEAKSGERVRIRARAQGRIHQGRRGVRRLRRRDLRSRRRAGRDRALPQGSPRRPPGAAARARDEAVGKLHRTFALAIRRHTSLAYRTNSRTDGI